MREHRSRLTCPVACGLLSAAALHLCAQEGPSFLTGRPGSATPSRLSFRAPPVLEVPPRRWQGGAAAGAAAVAASLAQRPFSRSQRAAAGAFAGTSRQVSERAERSRWATAAAAGSLVSCAINGFGRIGRNVLRCWLKRPTKPFNIVAINIGSMDAKLAAHLLKYDTVLGTLSAKVSCTEDSIIVDDTEFKVLMGKDLEDPIFMPWHDLSVQVVIEASGALNDFEGGSKHLAAGAKKVVLAAPGKDCPSYVVGVNEGKYDPATDSVISNGSSITNGLASVCKVLDENFGIEYGMMTSTNSYTGDQLLMAGNHMDPRRTRADGVNIVPTSTGVTALALAEVLPQLAGKLSCFALRVPLPHVSIIDLTVKVRKTCNRDDVNTALEAAAIGPMKGIINFEEQPLVSSDFVGSDFSTSVDAALTMVMGEDLVKVVMWYDNEWGYAQRVVDLTAIVSQKLPR